MQMITIHALSRRLKDNLYEIMEKIQNKEMLSHALPISIKYELR